MNGQDDELDAMRESVAEMKERMAETFERRLMSMSHTQGIKLLKLTLTKKMAGELAEAVYQ